MHNGVLEKRKPAPLWPQKGITSGKFKQLFELHQLCRKDFNSNVCSYFSTKKRLCVCVYVCIYLNLDSEFYVDIHPSFDTPSQQPSDTANKLSRVLWLFPFSVQHFRTRTSMRHKGRPQPRSAMSASAF